MESVWTEMVTVTGLIAVAAINLAQGKKLKRIDKQTTNEHQDTEYPNLRDEQTAIRGTVEALEAKHDALAEALKESRGLVHGVSHSLTRFENWLNDISNDRDAIDAMVERKEKTLTQALEAAVEDREFELKKRDRVIEKLTDSVAGILVKLNEKGK